MFVHEGVTSLIVHIRLGTMQAALEAKTTVPPAVGKEAECLFSRSESDSKLSEDRAQVDLVPCYTPSTWHSSYLVEALSKCYRFTKGG